MSWGADLTVPMPRGYPPRQVWIDLAIVYGPPNESDVPRPTGILLTGKIRGRLTDWVRARDGRWLGVVTFDIRDVEGERRYWQDKVLIPSAALTPVEPSQLENAQ